MTRLLLDARGRHLRTSRRRIAATVISPSVAGSDQQQHARGRRAVVLLVRKPLLLTLFLGCAASALTSGVFTFRLVVDGALSFAFVPVCEAAAVAALCPRRRMPLPYSLLVDRLFENNRPWLIWLVVLASVGAFVEVLQFGRWIGPILVSSIVPIVWSAWLDLRFFRLATHHSIRGAAVDVLLLRAVAWPLAFMYFLGAVFLSDVLPVVAGWLAMNRPACGP